MGSSDGQGSLISSHVDVDMSDPWDVERMKRFEAWLPQFEARLKQNRRRMKIYCAIAKLKRLLPPT